MSKQKLQTVRARVTIVPEPVTQTRTIPIIPREWIIDNDAARVAYKLWECDIQEDCEVAVLLKDIPSGVEFRKLTGTYFYQRADDDWVRRELQITDPRILTIGDRGNLCLEDPKRAVIAKLSDLLGPDGFEAVQECLEEYRCPQ